MSADGQDKGQGVPARAGTFAVVRAVMGAFIGIRRGRDLRRDAVTITPGQVIVAGIVGALLFVLCLVLVVRWVTH